MPVINTLDQHSGFKHRKLTAKEKKEQQAAIEQQERLVGHVVAGGTLLPPAPNINRIPSEHDWAEHRARNVAENNRVRELEHKACNAWAVLAKDGNPELTMTIKDHQSNNEIVWKKNAFPLEDIAELYPVLEVLVKHLDHTSMKALCGTSRKMRSLLFSCQKVWKLGTLEMDLCDIKKQEDREYLEKAGYHFVAPGPRLLISGRGEWKLDIADCELWMKPFFPFALTHFWNNNRAKRVAINLREYKRHEVFRRDYLYDQVPSNDQIGNLQPSMDQANHYMVDMSDPDKAVYWYLKQFSVLRPMLFGLAEHGKMLRHLELDSIPFVDRRVVATMAENLPQLEKVTIEACELIAINDVVPLLDYFYWLGKRRGGTSFVKLDIFPKIWCGTINGARAGTLILSPNGDHMINMPRAVLAVVFIAVMKAANMGYDIIDKDSLFVKFLMIVPMKFGLMHVFLKEVRAYRKICLEAAKSHACPVKVVNNMVTVAEHDCPVKAKMLRYIFAAMDELKSSSPHQQMQVPTASVDVIRFRCARCTFVGTPYLFPEGIEALNPDRRLCFVCGLEGAVHGDVHHWLIDKRRALSVLFSREQRGRIPYRAPQTEHMVAPALFNALIQTFEPRRSNRSAAPRGCWFAFIAHPNNVALHIQAPPWVAARTHVVGNIDLRDRYALCLGMDIDSADARQPRLSMGTWRSIYSWEEVYRKNILAQNPRVAWQADEQW